MLAAVAQLPGAVSAERDVPLHGSAKSGAQVQTRYGVRRPARARRHRHWPAAAVVRGDQEQTVAAEERHGRDSRQRHVLRH